MKKKIFRIFFLLLTLAGGFSLFAQSEEETVNERAKLLNLIEEEESIVIYDIPDDILNNLSTNPGALKRPGEGKKNQGGNSAVRKTQGYRIQVFSDGRNPSTLQSRAKARGNAIVAKFPKYRGQVYSFSSSPNWYTRVGNFQTNKEATDALNELKRAFPSFAAEMRVVKSPITIIK